MPGSKRYRLLPARLVVLLTLASWLFTRSVYYFSITARMDKAVTAAISRIREEAWVDIKYTDAIWDEQEQRWVSDAQVAEISYTAFTSRAKKQHVTARLIVRRVKRLNPKAVKSGQDELFATYRYHAVFTDSPLTMLAAEASHRGHAIIEQVIAAPVVRPFLSVTLGDDLCVMVGDDRRGVECPRSWCGPGAGSSG